MKLNSIQVKEKHAHFSHPTFHSATGYYCSWYSITNYRYETEDTIMNTCSSTVYTEQTLFTYTHSTEESSPRTYIFYLEIKTCLPWNLNSSVLFYTLWVRSHEQGEHLHIRTLMCVLLNTAECTPLLFQWKILGDTSLSGTISPHILTSVTTTKAILTVI